MLRASHGNNPIFEYGFILQLRRLSTFECMQTISLLVICELILYSKHLQSIKAFIFNGVYYRIDRQPDSEFTIRTDRHFAPTLISSDTLETDFSETELVNYFNRLALNNQVRSRAQKRRFENCCSVANLKFKRRR